MNFECPICGYIYEEEFPEGQHTCCGCGEDFFIEYDNEFGLLVSPIHEIPDEITMAKSSGLIRGY